MRVTMASRPGASILTISPVLTRPWNTVPALAPAPILAATAISPVGVV